MDTNTAMVATMAIIGFKLLDQVVAYFFKKATKDDYITKSECAGCDRREDAAVDKLASEISTIKGLLLVLAVKNEIPAEQLAKLTK